MHLNFACTLTFRKAEFRKHYDRSPHCRTVSLTVLSSFILVFYAYCCGVGIIHLDTHIIQYPRPSRNCPNRQFFFDSFGQPARHPCSNCSLWGCPHGHCVIGAIRVVTSLTRSVSLLLCKFQFAALLNRRNRLPKYPVIASHCAQWRGNPRRF